MLPVGWVSGSLLTLPRDVLSWSTGTLPRGNLGSLLPMEHTPAWLNKSTSEGVREMPSALLLALSLLSAWQKDRSEGQMPAHLLPTAATHTPHSELQQWLPQGIVHH